MSTLGDVDWLFNGRPFDREVIVLCVRWYLRYKLSFLDLAELMAGRGQSLAHTTIMRWVKYFTPEFVKCWNHLATVAGQSWRVDETCVRIRGKWAYLYRAVDRVGRTVDFRLSARRDVAAAKAFLAKAIRTQGRAPATVSSTSQSCVSKIQLRLPFGWQSFQHVDVAAITALLSRARNLLQSLFSTSNPVGDDLVIRNATYVLI
ncbi:transposase-like protein [Paraburkholderia sp. GAS32]